MSTSVDTDLDHAWGPKPTRSARWEELPTDGTHAWLGLLLVLGSSIAAIRGLCWIAALTIRLLH